MTTRHCERCTKEFTVKHPSDARKFCCPECVRLRFGIGQCQECGADFQRLTINHRICSSGCRQAVRDKLIDSGVGTGKMGKYYKRRFSILTRDGFTCRYCGRNPRDNSGIILCVDHIVPRSSGGNNEISNLITSCEQCNLGKADVMLEQHITNKIKSWTVVE